MGVREDYPQFGLLRGGERSGYEIEIARKLAGRLGVALDFVPVTPATRISALSENKADLVIATMGHTVERDGQARFIRPHYYASETVILGPRAVPVAGWESLAGATVCVTLGNNSNTILVSHNVRLLLFDTPLHLLDQLKNGVCPLVAQDDSFFAASLADPGFAARFDVKLGFATLPWGMAVGEDGTARLARVLSLLSQTWHRDGVFLALAEANHIRTDFPRQQQAVWRRPECDRPAAEVEAACVLPPLSNTLVRLPVAGQVEALEAWLHARFGLRISLPMFKTVVGFELFESGLAVTIVLVAGAMACTAAFAFGLAAIMRSRYRAAAFVVRWLALGFRSSPIVLLLFVGFTAATAVAHYSLDLALLVSVLVLGLFNGSYAAQSIADVHAELVRERGTPPSFPLLASRTATPITGFLINASKGSAAASMIGAPELVSAMTDISSFSAERITVYSLLLALYLLIIGGAILLCHLLQRVLHRLEPAT